MTNEALVKLIQAGQRELLADLWQQNTGLIWRWASRYQFAAEMDDLMQMAFIGLMKAVDGYRESEGVLFMSYARFHIRNSIRVELGLHHPRTQPRPTVVSLDDLVPGTDDITLLDTLASGDAGPLEQTELADTRRRVRASVDRLPQLQAEVLRRRWFEGTPFADIAEACGVGYAKACLLHKNALERLARDWRLLDLQTQYHRHKGVRAFRSSWSSVVEDAVLRRAERLTNVNLRART